MYRFDLCIMIYIFVFDLYQHLLLSLYTYIYLRYEYKKIIKDGSPSRKIWYIKIWSKYMVFWFVFRLGFVLEF